jgi:hypothetical protein
VAANQQVQSATAYLLNQGIHVSETAWVGTKFDAVIDNNSTIEDLYNQVRSLVLGEPAARADDQLLVQ